MKNRLVRNLTKTMLAAVSLLSLCACESDRSGRGTIPDDRLEGDEDPTPTAEPTQGTEPETPTPTEAPVEGKRELTDEEIERLNNDLTVEYNGFFLCDYPCPEYIDWNTVLYDGGGIKVDFTEDMYEAYVKEFEDVMTGITAIYTDDLEAYVKRTTGTEYSQAINYLYWDYMYSYDMYCHAHGDTNYMPITITSGEVDGDIYYLHYNKPDDISYTERDYLMTLRLINGSDVQFISNMPEDEPTMALLASMDFYEYKEDIPDPAPIQYIDAGLTDSDEPYGIGWAVITAKQDNTTFIVNRADISDDYKLSLTWENIFLPGKELCNITLDKDESFALYVNSPWNPTIHMSAMQGNFYASYWFGQDNGHHNEQDNGLPAPRMLAGYDRDARGYGTDPKTILQFFNMLEGNWLYFDGIGDPAATFYYDGYVFRLKGDNDLGYYEFYTDGENFFSSSSIPDSISIYANTDISDPLPKGNYDKDAPSSYSVTVTETAAERMLTLTVIDEKQNVLSYLLPDGEDKTSFEFHIFK